MNVSQSGGQADASRSVSQSSASLRSAYQMANLIFLAMGRPAWLPRMSMSSKYPGSCAEVPSNLGASGVPCMGMKNAELAMSTRIEIHRIYEMSGVQDTGFGCVGQHG